MLFLVVSNPRPERPSDLAQTRQSYWPWIAQYQESGQCKQVYARVGRGAVAIFDVESNEVLHRICLLYTSPSPRDRQKSRMPSSA